MLKIGEFSRLSRVSIRMLRHYDERGLLRPASTDPFTGYRYYTADQLLLAGRIQALREMGFGLAAIGTLLERYEDRDQLVSALCRKREELAAERQDTERRLLLLDTTLERLRKDDMTVMKYDVTRKTLPERYAATVRMTIPRYEDEGMIWSVLVSETAALRLQPDDPCYCSVVFHDAEFRETDVDVEAQKTVKGTYPDTEHVKFRTLPAVTFASAIHRGSYASIGEANAAVAAWIEANGYQYDGPMFNIYHVSPAETSDPEQFVTEVCYPVKK